LIHHRIDRFFELKNLTTHIHGDLLGKIAVGHGDGHISDATDLSGKITGHLVDRFCQVLPYPGNAANLCLTAEFAFGADFAGHPRHFRCKYGELIDHRVDQFCGAQELAFQCATISLQGHGLAQIALGHRADGASHFSRGPNKVINECVDGLDFISPTAAGPRHDHALLELAFLAHFTADAGRFFCPALAGGQNVVEGIG